MLCTLVWGSFHPISKHLMSRGLSPLIMSFLRFFFAVLPMIPLFVAELKKNVKPGWKDVAVLCCFGSFGVSGFSLLIYYGLEMSNATSSSILVNSQPLFASVLSALILKEKFTLKHLFGVIIGLFGITLVVTRGNFSALSLSNTYVLGNLLCVLGAISISVFYIGLKKYVKRFGSTIPTFITIAAGTVILFAVALAGGAEFGVLYSVSWKDWLWIVYIGVLATAITYIIFNRALHAIGVIRSTGFKFLVPVFGAILSILFLGERANAAVYVGIGIVLVAILFIQGPVGKQNKNRKKSVNS